MRLSLFIIPITFAAILGGAACSSPSTEPTSAESTGRVNAQLSTVGPDGATYSITSPASVVLASSALANAAGCEPLTTTATEQWTLPPGSYTAKLYPTQSCSPTDAAAPWTLTRVADGGTSTVAATLVTNPVPFAVTVGATTQFAFSFSIPQLGVLTFGTGVGSAGIQVDAAAPSRPGSVVISGTSMTYPEALTGPNAAVNTALAVTTPIAIPYSINLAITGSMVPGIDSVCAPVTATSTTTTTSNAGYAALVQELVGATGTLCFADPNSRAYFPNQVSLSIQRSGAPTTSLFQSALGATSTNIFGIVEVLIAPTPLYTGTTLSLGAYYQPIVMTPNNWDPYVTNGSTYLASVNGNGNGGSTATITFAP